MDTDVTVAIITAIGALLAALVVELIRRHSTVASDVRATKEQVQNSHATNLRDDLDDLHNDVRLVLKALEGVRDDLHVERVERQSLADRFENHSHAA